MKCKSKFVIALAAALMMVATASSPDIPAIKSIITGFVVQEKKTETCQFKVELRFNRFISILKKLGIDVEGEFTFCANFRWKSEEVKQKLSMLERRLEHQGKMVPVVRAELDILKAMIGE